MKQAVILAGGKGTRLQARLGNLPKPLVDVAGTPLLQRQIDLLYEHHFTHVLLLVNYQAETIVQFLRKRRWHALHIDCIDEGLARGTAGATLNAFERLAPEFLVMYGDTVLDVDLTRFYEFHSSVDAVASLFLHPNDHPHDSDLVEVDDNQRIVAFHSYPHNPHHFYPNLVNAALYWLKRQALAPWLQHNGHLDFGKDLFPAMLNTGLVIRGYKSHEYIKDCGTPERLDRVSNDVAEGRLRQSRLSEPQPVVFLDRDGTINEEVGHVRHAAQLKLLPGVGAAIRTLNESGYRICILTNQPVVSRGECSATDLALIHYKLDTLLGRDGAFIDQLYYCPHHPDRGFIGEIASLKITCSCRKPNVGLITKAQNDINIDFSRSWMIGDTTTDVLMAKRAGLRCILVETGHAGMDGKFLVAPDYVSPNLPAAIAFILNDFPRLLARCTEFAADIEKGQVVLIGGQSRSGKTTFANVLKEALVHQGKRCHVISTDRWLKTSSERSSGLLGRHDIESLKRLLSQFAQCGQGFTYRIPTYDKLRRQQVADADELEIRRDDVLIFEGVIALAIESGQLPCRRFFIYLDEQERAARVVREYRLRGMTEDQAIFIYEQRRAEEFHEIQRYAGSIPVEAVWHIGNHSKRSCDLS